MTIQRYMQVASTPVTHRSVLELEDATYFDRLRASAPAAPPLKFGGDSLLKSLRFCIRKKYKSFVHGVFKIK